ncbi:MAG: lytic murein transglycosylase [Acidimicrobiales bacterium]
MRVSYRVLSVVLGLFVVVSTTVVDAQTQTSVDFPDAETLATDGAAIENILAEVGLDASWRSTLDFHPGARALTVDYRDGSESEVAALIRTSFELAAVTSERVETVSDLRETATRLDAAFDEERDREIERNRADAYFQGINALTQAVAIDVFAGEDPSTSAILGLDGFALTAAQREFELTNSTLDEMLSQRQAAEDDLHAAIDAYENAVAARTRLEDRHATLVEQASELNATRRSLDASARAMLPAAAEAYTLAVIPGQPGMTAKALNAYLRAEQTLATLSPSCHVSWRTIAAIASVESVHGEYGGGRLLADGRPNRPIVGLALNGQTVDNYGNATANLTDTDGGRYDGDPTHDRAVGPLQFIPQTWDRWGLDADGDGERDPQDIDDAALSAGAYLCNYGSLRNWATWSVAIFGYNHSGAYVNSVKASLDRVQRLHLPEFEGDELLRQRIPYGAWVPIPDDLGNEPDPGEEQAPTEAAE